MNQTQTAPTTSAPAAAVLDFYAAMLSGDAESARARLHPDVSLRVPGTHPLAGRHDGPDAVIAFVTASRDLTDDGEQIEVLDVLTGATHVAVYCRVTARRGTAVLDNTTIHLLRVDGGRIMDIWLHNFDDVAVNEFWSRS